MGLKINLFANLMDKVAAFILYVTLIIILINMGGRLKLVAFIVIGIFVLAGILRGINTWLDRNN